jgi:membrane-associated phospholipid phosphatase
VLIYGSANWWSLHAPYRFRFWMDWELGLPFVPAWIVVYCSLNVLNLMPVFFLSATSLQTLGRSMLKATCIAGLIFFVFPAPAGFVRPPSVPGWDSWFKTLYSLDESGNTLPSLHITYSWMVVSSIATALAGSPHLWLRRLRVVFYFWMAGIAVAVVLVRQHHIADIIAGFILGSFMLGGKSFTLGPTYDRIKS